MPRKLIFTSRLSNVKSSIKESALIDYDIPSGLEPSWLALSMVYFNFCSRIFSVFWVRFFEPYLIFFIDAPGEDLLQQRQQKNLRKHETCSWCIFFFLEDLRRWDYSTSLASAGCPDVIFYFLSSSISEYITALDQASLMSSTSGCENCRPTSGK